MYTEWLGDLAEGQSPFEDTPMSANGILIWNRSAPLHLLTKGDNNGADDTELYASGQSYLDRSKDVVGSVVGYMPFVGYVTILLSEYPWLKTAMLVFMALTVVLQRE